MKKLLIQCLVLIPLSIAAQKEPKLRMDISSDTIGLNGTLEVVYTVENAQIRRFNPPKFNGFDVQGPATASSMSIVNGDMTQSSTFTFYLSPREMGVFSIGEAKVELSKNDDNLTTPERPIVVVEQYDAEIKPRPQRRQNPWGDNPFFQRQTPQRPPTDKPKKKYETEKI